MYWIDAHQIALFLECREMYRRQYIENIVQKKMGIYREYGKAIHVGIEMFWKKQPFSAAMKAALRPCLDKDLSALGLKEKRKWDEMVNNLPDLLAAYYEKYESWEIPETLAETTEAEWTLEPDWGFAGYGLCGRIDRFDGETLYDAKTASEYGAEWREIYAMNASRNFGLALYDWYLRRVGQAPKRIVCEVLIKNKQARVELIELPQIIAARNRFDVQLKWIVSELIHYREVYAAEKPWPMSTSACTGKFNSPCDYLQLCVYGDSEKALNKFVPREEHLKIRGAK